MKKLLLIDYPYPDGRARESALRAMGFDLRVFNLFKSRVWAGPGHVKRRIKPLAAMLRPLMAVARRYDLHRLNREAIEVARRFGPDIVLIIKGDQLSVDTVRRLKKCGSPMLVNWDGDSMLSPGRPRAVMPKLALYDRFFTVDEIELLPEDLRAEMRRRNPHIHTLPFAANTDYYAPPNAGGSGNADYSSSLAFIGTINPVRKALLEKLSDLDLRIWGPKTSVWGPWLAPGSPLEKAYRGHSIYGEELLRLYASAGAVLDIHFLFSTGRTIPNVTARVYEVPAAGGFVLTNASLQLSRLFRIDEEIVCYSGIEELREKAAYYLSHPKERSRIAENGRARVVREHTFRLRLETMMGIANVN
jgi:spore maturation protein CgeB